MGQLIKNKVIEDIKRIIRKDISVWIEDEEIDNRIDWIDLDSKKIVNGIKEKLGNIGNFDNVVLLGMGGSSLAPLVFTTLFPKNKDIFVLDTINPDQIKFVHNKIYGQRNIFIVSSKSGTTLETKILYNYFKENFKDDTFIFITDYSTLLDKEAKENNSIVFNPNPNVGGRYSAFTEFGLVPAFLAGVNIEKISQQYEEIKETLIDFIEKNFPEFFDIINVEKEFYYLFFKYNSNDFVLGLWLEQLIAESTGKNGKGILPVIFNHQSFNSFINKHECLGSLDLQKFTQDLPKWMYVWFIYTALISSYLQVNPFNQPDVQLSKDVTNQVMSKDDLKVEEYYEIIDNFENLIYNSLEYLRNIDDCRYVAIQFYSSYDYFDFVEGFRNKIVENLNKVVVWGFGPRYLHSIGQLYKGGIREAAFIQVVVEPQNTMSNISKAFISQAVGDLLTMKKLERKIKGFYVKTKN